MKQGAVAVFNILQDQKKERKKKAQSRQTSLLLFFVKYQSLMTTHHLTRVFVRLYVCVCQCRFGSLVSCFPGPRTAPQQIHMGSKQGDEMTLSCSHFSAHQHWAQKGRWHLCQVGDQKVSKEINCPAESNQRPVRIHHVFTSTQLNETLSWNLHTVYISTTTTTLATSHFHFHTLWIKNKSLSGIINYEFVSC